MTEALSPRQSYDRIAHLYDADMAANMRFDDVAFYARVCRAAGRRALELGCGNGRILLDLIARGIDAVGVDCSRAMLMELSRKAGARALSPRVCLMDARALGFGASFGVVLCPFSLVTYMTTAEDLARLTSEARRVLEPAGILVLDAFVPQPSVYSDEFRPDYERPYGCGSLRRSKRIRRLSPAINRIERCYEIRGESGALIERIETVEDIHTFARPELLDVMRHAGFKVESEWWNYAARSPLADGQFYTLIGWRGR